jgi:hypothetical protein
MVYVMRPTAIKTAYTSVGTTMSQFMPSIYPS